MVFGAFAQVPKNVTEVLTAARDKLIDRNDRIPNYICVETVNRSYYNKPSANVERESCDRIMGDRAKGKRKAELQASDRLRLDVKISDGTEIGAWAGARKFDSRSIIDFVGGGPFGTGALGTLLGDIMMNGHFYFAGDETLNGRTVFRYTYQVPVESSHYMVRAGTDWIATSFSGSLWIDPETKDLVRVTSASSELPPSTTACVADNDVSYERMHIGERDFLLPSRSYLHFVLRDGTETHNATVFSSCHSYHAESTVRFEESDENEKNSATSASPATTFFPPGLTVSLALDEPIDTDVAAAGDKFSAKVVDAVHAPHSHQTLIPSGAQVRGRIVGVRHVLGSTPHYEVTLFPQSIEINRVESPFNLRMDPSIGFRETQLIGRMGGRGVRVFVPPRGQASSTGTLYFLSTNSHYLVPAGYKSLWITE